MNRTVEAIKNSTSDFIFVNLVDTDMIYGHRRDIDGYAKALTYFDSKIPEIVSKMRDEDVLMITADHGCDPGYTHTDHTRECVPLLIYGKPVAEGKNFGTVKGFDSISASILNYFSTDEKTSGEVLDFTS